MYYRGLSLQADTEMCFMITIKKEIVDRWGNLNFVVNAIERTHPMSKINAKIKTFDDSVDEPKPNQEAKVQDSNLKSKRTKTGEKKKAV